MPEQDMPRPLFPDDEVEEAEEVGEDVTDIASENEVPAVARKAQQVPTEFLRWASPSRIYDSKSPQWFLGVFFIGLVAVVLLAILRELMLALFVIAVVFVFYVLARVEPSEVVHRVASNGVETGGRVYEWKDLSSFWIYRLKGVLVLRLDTKLYFPHTLELLLPEGTPDEDVEELSDLLEEYLPKQETPVSQAGQMADSAILSVANKLPGQQRMLGWLAKNLGIK